jgi:hypothetical protein
MYLQSWFVGVSRQAAKLRKQRYCGRWWRRGTGRWALPSDHQGALTSSTGKEFLLCSRGMIVLPIKGRDYLQETDRSFNYLLLVLISKVLYLFDASTTLEKQLTTLLTPSEHATSLHNQTNDPILSTRDQNDFLLQPITTPRAVRFYRQTRADQHTPSVRDVAKDYQHLTD